MALIPKKATHEFNPNELKVYLLGVKDNVCYWLREPQWDCDWYWSIGYIRTYTNNWNPLCAHDINSHEHFDSKFFNQNKDVHAAFLEYFDDITLSDKEVWTFVEIMKSLYTCKDFANMCHLGGSRITTNPCADTLKDIDMYRQITQVKMPKLFKELDSLLTNENSKYHSDLY